MSAISSSSSSSESSGSAALEAAAAGGFALKEVNNIEESLRNFSMLELYKYSDENNIQTHMVGATDAAGARPGTAASFAWSGYCLCKYSIIKAIGFAGFSMRRLSTI